MELTKKMIPNISFIDAIRNDIIYDREMLKYHQVEVAGFVGIPRLVSLNLPFQKNTVLHMVCSFLLWVFWPLIGFLFILGKFFSGCVYMISKKRRHADILSGKKVAVCLQSVTLILADRIPAKYQPEIAISIPKYNLRNSKDVKVIDIYEFVTLKDLIPSFFFACQAHSQFILGRNGFSNWIYSYYSFDWLLYQSVLGHVLKDTQSILYGNTHDRWAILLDRLDIPAQKNMIQHGILPHYITFRNRICNCSVFFYMKNTEQRQEKNNIFEANTPKEYIEQSDSLILSKYKEIKDEVVVLIILSLPPYDDYTRLMHKICKIDNSFVIIKPHPSYSSTEKFSAKESNCAIWNEIGKFPDCDIVISGQSTLSVEYKNIGKQVFMFNDYSMDELWTLTKNYIEGKNG